MFIMHKISKPKLVSLVITNYNGKKNTLEFLKSLKKTDYPNYEIIVVDNGSTDGSVEAIRKKFPRVKIVRNKENLGPAGGANSGIRKSKATYFVVLDNDMIAQKSNWLSNLVKTAESDKKIGIVAINRISFHNKKAEIQGVFRKSNLSKFILKILGSPLSYVGARLVKREVVEKIGLHDEKMFGDFEDTDFHYRAEKAGYKIVFCPDSILLHKGAMGMGRGYFRMFHHYKNKLRFILKNYGGLEKLFALSANICFYISLMPYYFVIGRVDLSKAVRDGIAWNIKNWKDYFK